MKWNNIWVPEHKRFWLELHAQSLLVMIGDGSCCILTIIDGSWPILDGLDPSWMVLIHLGWSWSTLDGLDSSWIFLTYLGWAWPTLDGLDLSWIAMKTFLGRGAHCRRRFFLVRKACVLEKQLPVHLAAGVLLFCEKHVIWWKLVFFARPCCRIHFWWETRFRIFY